MITGDNPLTGSNIAYKCEIAHLNKKMLICDYKLDTFTFEEFFYH
jgi:magnesium-transporting ATPase (P-type)